MSVLPHHLLGCHEATIDTIQEIYSHPQGFQQSRLFLDKFPQWKHIPYYNTAISAQLIAEEQDPKKQLSLVNEQQKFTI